MDRVRLGVVGVGNIAPLNVAGYLAHDLCDVVSLCDPREEKANEMAAKWNVPKVYTNLADLLADDEIDAVEILTPTHMHRDHVIESVRAGKHVSCQKPIANSVADAREMAAEARSAGVIFRVSECCYHYPPLELAKKLVEDGAIGEPTMCRIKTVVGDTDSEFQHGLEWEGYIWRLDHNSPGGHLFDDMVHKYAMAPWLVGEKIRSVQAIVREGPTPFEAPMAAIWEYERKNLLGMMDVEYAPDMYVRSKYFGADEFYEIQGTKGLIWVTRATGEMLDLAPVILYNGDGTTTSFSNVNADYLEGFKRSSAHFIDSLINETVPDMTAEAAIETLQLCFAVYQASHERRPVDPSSIETSYSPPWWPPTPKPL